MLLLLLQVLVQLKILFIFERISWCQVRHLYVYVDMDVNIDTIFSRVELRKFLTYLMSSNSALLDQL